MAKRKKHKTGLTVTGYVEKISSQIFEKMLPALKKRIEREIREELANSFKLTPPNKLHKSFKLTPAGKPKRRKRAKVKK